MELVIKILIGILKTVCYFGLGALAIRLKIFDRHYCAPPFSRTITGSPPAGYRMFSASGSIARIAASSLAI